MNTRFQHDKNHAQMVRHRITLDDMAIDIAASILMEFKSGIHPKCEQTAFPSVKNAPWLMPEFAREQ